MTDYYVGEIRLLAISYAPIDFLPCDGRLLPIIEYQALYSLLGSAYGGDGVNTFALPDLRGRVPVAIGQTTGTPTGTGATNYALAQKAGAETVTITQATTPTHTHTMSVSNQAATDKVPGPALTQASVGSNFLYVNAAQAATAVLTFAADALSSTANNTAHPNVQPSTVLTYAIATTGLYPVSN